VGAGRPEEARGYQGASVAAGLLLGVLTMGVGQIAVDLLSSSTVQPSTRASPMVELSRAVPGRPVPA